MKYVLFKKGKQREFILEAKKKSGLNWLKFAKTINRSRELMFCYSREECKIPITIVEYLTNRYNIQTKNIKIINQTNTPKEVRLPELSKEFAEFLGALAGDGCLSKNPKGIHITCHKRLDKDYIYYLYNLFEKIFKVTPKLNEQENVLKLYFYSTQIVDAIQQRYNFPIGKKKGLLVIPEKIKNNKNYLIAYLRGVFDTDGCICRHHINSGAIIEISSRDKVFLDEINEAFIYLGFNTSKGFKNVKIYRKKDIDYFFGLIKPANPKHIFKYKSFKRTGKVPLTSDWLARVV